MKNTLKTIAICGLLVSPQLFCMDTPVTKSRISKIGTAIRGAVWNKKTGIGSAVVATSAAAGIATYLLAKNNKYTAMAVAAIPAALGLAYLVYKSAPYAKSASVKAFNGTVSATKATGRGITFATRATGHGIATATKASGHGIVVAAKSPWTGIKKLSSMVGRLFAKKAAVGGPVPVPAAKPTVSGVDTTPLPKASETIAAAGREPIIITPAPIRGKKPTPPVRRFGPGAARYPLHTL